MYSILLATKAILLLAALPTFTPLPAGRVIIAASRKSASSHSFRSDDGLLVVHHAELRGCYRRSTLKREPHRLICSFSPRPVLF
jgi:hypothetical protein